jgi:hypothetical protein
MNCLETQADMERGIDEMFQRSRGCSKEMMKSVRWLRLSSPAKNENRNWTGSLSRANCSHFFYCIVISIKT